MIRLVLPRNVIAWGLLFVTAGCCASRPPWPVPVPPGQDINQVEWRLELSLPLSDGCEFKTRQEYWARPTECPQVKRLLDFFTFHTTRMRSVGEKASLVDDQLWEFLRVLASRDDLRESPFPASVASLPADIRKLHDWQTADARDEQWPQGRLPVALLYRNFWWTFWEKKASAPPLPDTGTPKGSLAFNWLIVFPEFPGRLSKERRLQ